MTAAVLSPESCCGSQHSTWCVSHSRHKSVQSERQLNSPAFIYTRACIGLCLVSRAITTAGSGLPALGVHTEQHIVVETGPTSSFRDAACVDNPRVSSERVACGQRGQHHVRQEEGFSRLAPSPTAGQSAGGEFEGENR